MPLDYNTVAREHISPGAVTEVHMATNVWYPMTLAGAWVYAGFGQTAAYMRDASGIVHLRGLVSGGATGTTITTLPVGYRPSVVDFVMLSSYSVVASPGQVARIDVSKAGVVSYTDGVAPPSNVVTLDGLTYDTQA